VDGSAASSSIKSALSLLQVVDDFLSKYIGEIDNDQVLNPVSGSMPHRESRQSLQLQPPVVTISYAQTLDGSIAPLERARLDISSNCSWRLLHSLRALHDGVLIGINTLVLDAPRLNVRDPLPANIGTTSIASGVINQDGVATTGKTAPTAQTRQPRPIVIDSDLRFVDVPNILLQNPIICTCLDRDASDENARKWARAEKQLQQLQLQYGIENGEGLGGPRIIQSRRGADGRCDLAHCLELLSSELGIKSVLVEGGAGIIQSMLEQRLVDQMVVTIRPCYLGGYRSLTRQMFDGHTRDLFHTQLASVGGDMVLYGQLRHQSRHTFEADDQRAAVAGDGDAFTAVSDMSAAKRRKRVKLVVEVEEEEEEDAE